MDYESLKEQWSDIEDRDGIRLAWNTFPSSRMVRCIVGRYSASIASANTTPTGGL